MVHSYTFTTPTYNFFNLTIEIDKYYLPDTYLRAPAEGENSTGIIIYEDNKKHSRHLSKQELANMGFATPALFEAQFDIDKASVLIAVGVPVFTEDYVPYANALGTLTESQDLQFINDNFLQVGGEGADTFNFTGLRVGDGGVGNACTTVATWGAQWKGSNSSPGFYFFDHHTQANSIGANIFFYRTRGNASAPSNALNGDKLGSIFFACYRGGAYTNSALIQAAKTEDDTTGAGCELKFHVNKNGQTSSTPTLAVSIKEGNLQMVEYGVGNKDAATLGKTQSVYLSGLATDGTIIEVEMGGSFADDTAAGVGGVNVGEVYQDSTTGKLRTRMS